MPRAGAEPSQEIEARRDLAKAGEMVLDEKSAVVAECFGLDIILDKLAEALAAIGLGAAAPGLGTAEESKSHCIYLRNVGVSQAAPSPASLRSAPSPAVR